MRCPSHLFVFKSFIQEHVEDVRIEISIIIADSSWVQ